MYSNNLSLANSVKKLSKMTFKDMNIHDELIKYSV